MRGRAVSSFLLCLLCSTAQAQFKASIRGTVTDTTGARVLGATLTVTNKATARSLQTISSPEGFYQVTGLAPGRYSVTAELQGFKKTIVDDVVVSAEEVTGLDITLELGAVVETVTVTAEAPLATENANVTKAFTTDEIQRLPQVGRDPYELIRLTPGVFGDGARSGTGDAVLLPNVTGPSASSRSIYETENRPQISANGQRVSANNFQVDGVSVNSLTHGGAAVVTPNQESVKEIRVLSTSYSAEDGRNTGAQIKLVTKSGTNDYHGSSFLKLNDAGLNAHNKYGGLFLPPQRVEQHFRQFGGSVGGPILREKLFFFFSYEGLRRNSRESLSRFAETPEFRQLVRSIRSGGITAAIFGAPEIEPRIINVVTTDCSRFGNDPTRCQVVSGGLDIGSPTGSLGTYVDDFATSPGGGLDGIPDIQLVDLSLPSRFRGHQFNTRVDYNRGNDQFAVTTFFTRHQNFGSDAAAQSRPMADIRSGRLNSAATLIWNRTLSTTLLNEARYNFTRWAFNELASNQQVNFGIPRTEVEGLPLLPGGERIRWGAPRSETTPGIFAENTFEFRDTLSKVWRNHALKFGGELRWEQWNNNLLGGARPVYSFVGLWNLANDAPIFEAINVDPVTGRPADAQRYFRTRDYAFFIQDDWKFRQNLTLNLGLRYEYFTPLRERRGRNSNIVLGPGGTVDRVVLVDELFDGDQNNWAPSFGFAWNPTHFDNRLVVRGGARIGYNRVPFVLYSNTRGNPPFFARHFICCGFSGDPFAGGRILYAQGSSNSPTSYPLNPALAQGIDPATGGVVGSTVEIYGTEPKLPNGHVYSYSLDLQYQLPQYLVVTAGYQGSSSHKFIRILNQNLLVAAAADCDPTAGFRPCFALVFVLRPDVNANYNALNLRLTRRFAQGFQAEAYYRWSKSIDTLSFEGPGFETNQTNPADLRSERGPSDYDVRHYFVFSGLWDLPILRIRRDFLGKALGGWQLNGIWTFRTGFSWTPKIDNCIRMPSGEFNCPVRPTAYFGGALNDHSDEAFIRPGGNFPGGGALYFEIPGFPAGPPGIGRNSFRGPWFNGIDLSLVKRTGLPEFFGEGAYVEFRTNFFNIFNELNLEPFRYGSAGVFANRPDFGRSERGLAGRVVEFQMRLSF